MYLRAGKTKKFSAFHVENGKIQSMLWFYVCFNVEIRVIWVKNKLFLRFMYVFYEITRFLGKKRLIFSKLQMIYANKMLNSVFFSQIKHISTKKNFEMYLRAGKTKKFSVFHVENGKIQSMLWFYVCFNVEIRVIWVKNKLFLRFMYVFYEITRFLGKKG